MSARSLADEISLRKPTFSLMSFLLSVLSEVDLLHVTFHNRAQRADLLFILFDLREVPRTLLLEARHQRVGAFAFEGQPGRNRVVRDAQPVVVGHQPPQVVLDRVAVGLQQLVVEHLLAVDAEVEHRKRSQDHREDDDDDAVAEDGFARIGLRGGVVVVFDPRIVSSFVFVTMYTLRLINK